MWYNSVINSISRFMEEQNKNVKQNGNKKLIKVIIIVAVVFSLLTVAAIVAIGFLVYSMNMTRGEVQKEYIEDVYMENDTQNQIEINDSINQVDKVNVSEELVPDVEVAPDSESKVISNGDITWNQPEDMGDLGYFKNNGGGNCAGESTYYHVANVTGGLYAGYEMYTVEGYAGCEMMMGDFVFRMLLNEADADDAIFFKGYERFSQWEVDVLKDYIGGESNKRIIDGNIIVEDLVFEEELQHGGVVIWEREYTGNMFYPKSYDMLIKAFDTAQGVVWVTNRASADAVFANKKNKSEQDYKVYDVFNSNAFFLRAPDGTAVRYKLKFDFIPEKDKGVRFSKLPIIWNGGEKNSKEYELSPVGCGTVAFAYDFTNKVKIESDLKVIGTMKGQKIYGYKNTNHSEFEKLYKDIYWSRGGAKKNEEDFLDMNPQIFWIDPVGRTLSFYLTDIISPAECGKPVIYLYPEEEMDIHVQVAPRKGFSITDPKYGNDGWHVRATTDSVITNLADDKEYPYLFWEGHSDEVLPQNGEGFVVSRHNLNQFFDEKLKSLGLNVKETADFKEFWIPEMVKNEKNYYFVTFLSGAFINKSAPLDIEPKPDTVIRVLMDYHGLDEYKNVTQQRLATPERRGFTVVEWGGVLK